MGKDWDSGNNFIPAMTEIFKETLRCLKPGAHGLVWALPRTSHWTATALENAGFEIRDVVTHLFGSGFPKSHNLGEGRGTALKPASEHWILVRKPISEKTIAANVLKWGTGGINIDECRIEGHNPSIDRRETARKTGHSPTSPGLMSDEKWINRTTHETYSKDKLSEYLGRFPANLVLDEEAAEMLDEQSGELGKSAGGNSKNVGNKIYGKYEDDLDKKPCGFGDKGGASRFFYCAKSSKKDRGTDNVHPCVKSTKLMEYLIKLITPPNGIVLDPFMGSGSTGVAAKRLGFNFIGIEKEKEYFDIAMKRIS